MDRLAARYVGKRIGMSTEWVYDIWMKMGLVVKDKFGDWELTELGKLNGGRMSKSNYPVPTFEFKDIEKLMIDFYNKTKNK